MVKKSYLNSNKRSKSGTCENRKNGACHKSIKPENIKQKIKENEKIFWAYEPWSKTCAVNGRTCHDWY